LKHFTYPVYRLSAASREIKIIYTGFLIFIAVGMLTIGLYQFKRIGATYDLVAAYYRGGELEQEMTYPKTFTQLLETTHFHAFIIGISFLTLAHLFIGTSLSSRAKWFFIGLAFFSSQADIAGPWLIRYLSPAFALLQLASWLGMWLGYGALILLPLYEMWGKSRK
jgi:magnesium-transporting ATPase (P-type)